MLHAAATEKNLTNLSYFTALIGHALMWDNGLTVASLYDDTALANPNFSFSYETTMCELWELRADKVIPTVPHFSVAHTTSTYMNGVAQ